MARRGSDHWLLIRLAAQNVARRRLRALFLGAAVMLGVGIGFAGFVAGWALRDGMSTSFSRMGADLLVVPHATLVNITASLLTVQPTDATLPADLAPRIAAIAGIARVAPQRIVTALVEGQAANLIAFDPARDFSVLTWLEQRQGGAVDGLIAGGRLAARPGATLSVCGMPLRVDGRLGKTGVGPFDESYFLSFRTLGDIVAFCRGSNARAGAKPPAPPTPAEAAAAAADMSHASCARPTCRPTASRRSWCSSRRGRRWRTSNSAWPGCPRSRWSKATPCSRPRGKRSARCSSAWPPSPRWSSWPC
jgi:putative ABC transport system permease protein